ncbi:MULTISPECIES: hypothetical protein [Sphingobacterium]|uniref:hypothetical protein n=1 Tax=Sphingobacterium TaxID=28453 RepID=UPI00257FBF51|nr:MULTISPECIES: hypothetical protein [Sphingobacterium]
MKTSVLTGEKKKKMPSLVEQTRVLCQEQIQEICRLMKWTEQEYCDHQFEQYEIFLKRALFGAHINVFNKVRFSPLMRGLWINEWMRRNEDIFLPMARYNMFEGMEVNEKGILGTVVPDEESRIYTSEEYYTLHNGKRLYADADMMVKFGHVLNLIYKQ